MVRVEPNPLFDDDVEADMATARRLGVRGVAFYVIGDHIAVGTQPTSVFVRALRAAMQGAIDGMGAA